MAVQQTQVLPAPFIEAAGKTFVDDLTKGVGAFKGADLSKTLGPQFVAGLDPLQQQAAGLAKQGVGSFEPFIQAAQAATGPQAYQAFMSPYQRDVISTTLEGFDQQASRGLGALSDAAVASGAFGGARQGVAEAEYMAQSDRNRAALQAQLLQQGFGWLVKSLHYKVNKLQVYKQLVQDYKHRIKHYYKHNNNQHKQK